MMKIGLFDYKVTNFIGFNQSI